MKVVWGNTFDNANNYRTHEKKAARGATGQSVGFSGNALFKNESIKAREAELKLREAEDKLLEQYRGQILEIEATDDDDKTKKVKIATVTEQIKQIEEARAQREREAAARELEKQQAEAEKRANKAENQSAGQDSAEQNGISKEDAEGMVKLSVSYESIKELSRTKAMVKSEAKQLEIDIENDTGVMKYGSVKTGHMTPNDFKHRQLNKLNKGTAGIEQSLASEVRKMTRIVAESAEEEDADTPKEAESEKL